MGSIHNKSNPNCKDLDSTEIATNGFCEYKDMKALQNKGQTQQYQDNDVQHLAGCQTVIGKKSWDLYIVNQTPIVKNFDYTEFFVTNGFHKSKDIKALQSKGPQTQQHQDKYNKVIINCMLVYT